MNETEKAIEHFHYGITHDIFSEPVKTYARLAVDALREQAKRSGCAVCNSLFAMRYETICDWSDDGKAVWETNVMHFCPDCGKRLEVEQ